MDVSSDSDLITIIDTDERDTPINLEKNDIPTKKSRTSDRHRKIECTVCFKKMRSDKLKRHRRIHKDLLSLPDEQVKEELRKRHAI